MFEHLLYSKLELFSADMCGKFLKDATKNLAKQRKKYDRSVEDNMWLM